MEYNVTSEKNHVSVQFLDWPIRGVAQASNMGDFWYLNRVVVSPDSNRNQGIGGQLLARLQEELRKQDCKKLIVEPGGYGSDPEQLFRFYKKHGFIEETAYLAWYPENGS